MKKLILGIAVVAILIVVGYFIAQEYYNGTVEFEPQRNEQGEILSTSENAVRVMPRERIRNLEIYQ